MHITYDRDVDAVYVRLSNRPSHHTLELDQRRLVDYSADGSPVGVELLHVRQGVNVTGLPEPEAIAHLLREQCIEAHSNLP